MEKVETEIYESLGVIGELISNSRIDSAILLILNEM